MSEHFYRAAPKKRRAFADEFIYSVAFILLVVIPGLWIANQQSKMVETGYLVNQLRRETAVLREERIRLQAEVAALKNPRLIQQKAARMGLGHIAPQNRIQVFIQPMEDLPQDAMIAGTETP